MGRKSNNFLQDSRRMRLGGCWGLGVGCGWGVEKVLGGGRLVEGRSLTRGFARCIPAKVDDPSRQWHPERGGRSPSLTPPVASPEACNARARALTRKTTRFIPVFYIRRLRGCFLLQTLRWQPPGTQRALDWESHIDLSQQSFVPRAAFIVPFKPELSLVEYQCLPKNRPRVPIARFVASQLRSPRLPSQRSCLPHRLQSTRSYTPP